jgi:hypothetical protein
MSVGAARSRRRPRTRRRDGADSSSPSTREVCLIGIDDRERPADWRLGARVAWLGRDYRIHGQDRAYVHLAADVAPGS